MSNIGPDFDPVQLGLVKRIKVVTDDQGTELLVQFFDGGALAVRAAFGEQCTLDVRPARKDDLMGAHRAGLVHGVTERATGPRDLYDAARLACFSCGLPWTDPRTGVTHLPPPLTDAPELTDEVVDAFLANAPQDPERAARIKRFYEGMSAKANDRPADEPQLLDKPKDDE